MNKLTPPPIGAKHDSDVFQNWYVLVYKILYNLDSNVEGLSSQTPRPSAYPAFGIRAGNGVSVSQDALGFTINVSANSDQLILANRIFQG